MANEQCNEKLTFIIHSCFWIEMYFAIWRKIEKSSQEEYLKYYPDLSIVITKALVDSSVIALSRIYDTHKDSTADIYSLLNSIESDKSFINSGNLTEIKQFAKEQKKILISDEFKMLINNLRTWRDKYYAHRDKIFLNDEDALRDQYPINVKDFEQLLNFARNIAKKIYILINGHDLDTQPAILWIKDFCHNNSPLVSSRPPPSC